MPRFTGNIIAKAHHQTAFREVYEFNVVPPVHEDYDRQAVLPAFVTDEVDETHIARELAEKFGASNEGDEIELTLQEIFHDGSIHRFRLPVIVKFASESRGPEYVQIGLSDLFEHFELRLWRRHGEQFLELRRKADSDRQCIEEFGGELAVAGDIVD